MATDVFQLVTKDLCLFCLNECSSSSMDLIPDPDQQTDIATSFKLLMRYLKVDMFKLANFSSSFTTSSVNSSLSKEIPILLSLCDRCTIVIHKFQKYLDLQEQMRLQVDSCVQAIHGVITNAQKDKLRINKYRERINMRNPGELLNASVVENVWKETLQKCALKISSSIPRVALSRESSDEIPLSSHSQFRRNPASSPSYYKVPFDMDQDQTHTFSRTSRNTSQQEIPVDVSDSLDVKPFNIHPISQTSQHLELQTPTSYVLPGVSSQIPCRIPNYSGSVTTSSEYFSQLPQNLGTSTSLPILACSLASASGPFPIVHPNFERSPIPIIICRHCGRHYLDDNVFQEHVLTDHTIQALIKFNSPEMTEDEFSFVLKNTLDELPGIRTTTPYYCSHCDVPIETKQQLDVHVLTKHLIIVAKKLKVDIDRFIAKRAVCLR